MSTGLISKLRSWKDWGVPRTYENGERGNIPALAKRFNFDPWEFRYQQSKGWPDLGGRRLRGVQEKIHQRGPRGARPKDEITFRFDEVGASWAAFLKRPKSTTYPVATADGGKWCSIRLYQGADGRRWRTVAGTVCKPLNLPHGSVCRWIEKPCRFLKDSAGNARTMTSCLVQPPASRNSKEVTVLLEEDLKAIAAARKAAPKVQIVHDSRHYFTLREFCRVFETSTYVPIYWSKKRKSKIRPGEHALRTHTEIHQGKRGPITVTYYCKEDYEAERRAVNNGGRLPRPQSQAGTQTASQGPGRRPGVTLERTDRLREAVLKDHQEKKYPSVAALGKAHRISRSRASQIIHGLA